MAGYAASPLTHPTENGATKNPDRRCRRRAQFSVSHFAVYGIRRRNARIKCADAASVARIERSEIRGSFFRSIELSRVSLRGWARIGGLSSGVMYDSFYDESLL